MKNSTQTRKYRATVTIDTDPFSATDEDNAEVQAEKFISYVSTAMEGIIGMRPFRCSVVVQEVPNND